MLGKCLGTGDAPPTEALQGHVQALGYRSSYGTWLHEFEGEKEASLSYSSVSGRDVCIARRDAEKSVRSSGEKEKRNVAMFVFKFSPRTRSH